LKLCLTQDAPEGMEIMVTPVKGNAFSCTACFYCRRSSCGNHPQQAFADLLEKLSALKQKPLRFVFGKVKLHINFAAMCFDL
jgi:hypothetical protein